MRNLNNRGFALVETLIVSAFVMGIFSLLYTNFYPLIGEYEKRETYDSIDSVYKTDLWKRFITKTKTTITSSSGDLTGDFNFIKVFNASQNGKNEFCNITKNPQECSKLWDTLNVNTIILSSYTITTLKSKIKDINTTEGMKEYISYLPKYETNTQKYRGRIIVEYLERIDNERDNGSEEEKFYNIYKYATLGVDLYD